MRARLQTGFASQLGRPRGLRGRCVGALLNRRNRDVMRAAVDALSLAPDAHVADVGFGGGAGLGLLLRSVGSAGQVHGVEMSETMRAQAAHRFRRDVAAGRLRLHTASMTELPLATGALDGIITLNTIYYVTELERAFSELARVLQGAGRLTLGIADPNAMARRSFTQHGLLIRSVPEITNLLHAAGLRVEDHRQLDVGGEVFHLLAATPRLSTP